MPSFVIHVAIANQYMKKHKTEIKNEKELIAGTIAPDLYNNMMPIPSKNKNGTHYGRWYDLQEINIGKFLEDPKVDIKQDYWKGYMLHLLADYYFYNKYFKKEIVEMEQNGDSLYYDYDCMNKEISEKYNVKLFENIKQYAKIIDGNAKYLNTNKVIDFIEEMSDINLEDIIKIIEEKGMEGIK